MTTLPTSALYDDFTNNTTLSTLWSSSNGTITISGGTCSIPCGATYDNLYTTASFNLINSYVHVKATPYTGTASAQSYLNVIDGSGRQLNIGYDGNGNMGIRKIVGGQTYLTQFAYSATTHAWWRLRADNTNFYADTSADGITWTNRFTGTLASVPIDASSVRVQLSVGHYAAGTDGTSTFQNFSTNATIPNPLASVKGTVSGGMFTPTQTVPLPGPRALNPANTKGNLLLVVAAWNNAAVSVPTPAGAVADDQGNWWRYVGDSGQSATGIRVGAWICSNAQAVQSWLSFCPQGYSAAFIYHVTEIQGVPASYWPLLDFHVAGGVASGTTSQTLNGRTRHDPDFVFVATAGQSYTTTISSPGAAWTNIFSGTQGSALTDVSIALRTDWATFAPLAAPSASWTYGGTVVGAAASIMVGITMNNYLGSNPSPMPAQQTAPSAGVQNVAQMFPVQRPFFPRVVIEGAFGSNPGDSTVAILDDAWYDMTPFALGKRGQQAISAIRGQQYELSTPEAGSLTVAMNNQAGDFNPQFPGSMFYSNALNSSSGADPFNPIWPTSNPVSGDMSFQNGVAGFLPANLSTANGLKAQLSSSAGLYASGTGAIALLSLQLTPDGVTPAPLLADTNFYRIDPNKQYNLSVSALSLVGYATGFQVQIDWYDRWFGFITQNPSAGTPLVANVRATVATGLVTPPSNAAFAKIKMFYAGTPTASAVVYASEFALTAGPLTTGQVRLGVPVRASCFWNGRRYPVGFGYVERWPQDWPDIPQWGWSTLVATDVVGVAASVNLPSAVQGEMLADSPYFCFPFNEKYTSATSQALPFQGADGMFAVNFAQNNQRPAIYTNGINKFLSIGNGQSSGNTDLIATGQSMGLLGDSGTGMGNSSDSALSLTVSSGAGAIYGPDPSLPSGSQTYEFWTTAPTVSSIPGVTTNTKLMDVVCEQDLSNKSLGDGVLFSLGLQYNTGGALYPSLWVATNSTAVTSVFALQPGQTTTINGTVFDLSAWHIQAQVNTSTNQVKVYVNGVLEATVSYNNPFGGPVAVVFGQTAYNTGLIYNTYQFAMAYGTLFSYLMPSWRTWCHSQAGLTGFALDGTTDRALRYLAWAGLNLGLAGPQDTISDLGPAYSTANSSLASAINGDCAGFGSRWSGSANGNLVLLSRQAQYAQWGTSQSAAITFGDAPTAPSPNLNYNPGFEYALTGWNTTNGSLALTTDAFSGQSAAVFTCNGGTNPGVAMGLLSGSVNIPVSSSTWYDATFWLKSPQGLNTQTTVNIDWYNGATFLSTSSSQPAWLLPGVWTPVVLSVLAPATATIANVYFQINGTPASGTQIEVDLGTLRKTYEVIPYLPAQAYDFDNTYLNNEVQTSISIASATGATPTVRDASSILQYFQRGPLSQSVNGTTPADAYDQANWGLNRYKQPSLRVRTVEVVPSSSPYSFGNVLATDVGDIANAARAPLNATRYTAAVIAQRVETKIGPGVWSAQYQLSPGAPQSQVLQAEPGTVPSNVIANNVLAW